MPTRQAFTVEMVGREDVANAVALNSAVFNGARVIGPAIAGLTIGFFGGDVSVAFLLNGISFAAVIVGVRRDAPGRSSDVPPVLPRPRSVREVGVSARGGPALRPADGARAARDRDRRPGVDPRDELRRDDPGLAHEVLNTDATGYGFLMTATGIGSLVAALGIAFRGARGRSSCPSAP